MWPLSLTLYVPNILRKNESNYLFNPGSQLYPVHQNFSSFVFLSYRRQRKITTKLKMGFVNSPYLYHPSLLSRNHLSLVPTVIEDRENWAKVSFLGVSIFFVEYFCFESKILKFLSSLFLQFDILTGRVRVVVVLIGSTASISQWSETPTNQRSPTQPTRQPKDVVTKSGIFQKFSSMCSWERNYMCNTRGPTLLSISVIDVILV